MQPAFDRSAVVLVTMQEIAACDADQEYDGPRLVRAVASLLSTVDVTTEDNIVEAVDTAMHSLLDNPSTRYVCHVNDCCLLCTHITHSKAKKSVWISTLNETKKACVLPAAIQTAVDNVSTSLPLRYPPPPPPTPAEVMRISATRRTLKWLVQMIKRLFSISCGVYALPTPNASHYTSTLQCKLTTRLTTKTRTVSTARLNANGSQGT